VKVCADARIVFPLIIDQNALDMDVWRESTEDINCYTKYGWVGFVVG
jgi:hypothetical protein